MKSWCGMKGGLAMKFNPSNDEATKYNFKDAKNFVTHLCHVGIHRKTPGLLSSFK